MNPQRDESLLRRYREASSELDERPSAGTRAAILAAAAREAGAGPTDANSGRAGRRRQPRLHWPWAAAAAVMLSTLAVMMATRTEHEQPTFAPPSAPAAGIRAERAAEPGPPASEAVPPGAQPAQPPAAAVAEAGRNAQPGVAPRSTPSLRKENRELAAAPEPAKVARAKTESAAETGAVVADARVPEPAARSAPMPAAPPAASAPARTAESSTAAGAIGGLRSSEREVKEAAEERARRQDAIAGTAKLAQKPAADESDAAIEARPEDWLQKIVRLRAAGRHDEAEGELKRFRERYPQWPVPPAALAPAATR